MKNTIEPINLYFWQKFNQFDPRVIFSNMQAKKAEYEAKTNARQLSRFIMNCIPSNTNDIIFGAIADSIRVQFKNNPDLLLTPYHIENCIRIALNELERNEK
jgi:hypothetical protein